MNRFHQFTLAVMTALALAACGDKDAGTKTTEDDGGHAHEAPHGGLLAESSDHTAHFEVVADEGAGKLTLYLYDEEMKPVTTKDAPMLTLAPDSGGHAIEGTCPEKGSASDAWTFEHVALKEHVHGRLRVKIGGRTYTPDLPEDAHAHEEDDHAHEHEHDAGHGPHDGVLAEFETSSGRDAGWLELKLHDDKGDLELWLAKDKAMKEPFLLSLDSEIQVAFESHEGKTVTLRVRNKDKNEDEDGNGTVHDGKTNYFIFPGDTGADAKWLMGEDFEAKVRVSFSGRTSSYKCASFELVPHGHGGHDHDHGEDEK